MIACPAKGLRVATGVTLFVVHLPCYIHYRSIIDNSELCDICVLTISKRSSTDGIGSICLDVYDKKDGYFKI